jgi:hypothetical protein
VSTGQRFFLTAVPDGLNGASEGCTLLALATATAPELGAATAPEFGIVAVLELAVALNLAATCRPLSLSRFNRFSSALTSEACW